VIPEAGCLDSRWSGHVGDGTCRLSFARRGGTLMARFCSWV
jgi:hypothetical protein